MMILRNCPIKQKARNNYWTARNFKLVLTLTNSIDHLFSNRTLRKINKSTHKYKLKKFAGSSNSYTMVEVSYSQRLRFQFTINRLRRSFSILSLSFFSSRSAFSWYILTALAIFRVLCCVCRWWSRNSFTCVITAVEMSLLEQCNRVFKLKI